MKYEEIIDELKKKIYRPVYFLCGEESYYIDSITQYIEDHVLDEMEKEFNFTVCYGLDTQVEDVIASCKRFPMMSPMQVVIVKEAQNLKKIEELTAYINNPLDSTVLVLCYKGKKPDERKEFGKTVKKKAVYLNAEKLRDYQVGPWIMKAVPQKGLKIAPKESELLAEFMGNDLARIYSELDKLKVLLPEGSEITADVIQRNIGVSKEYNIFEFQKALGEKNVLKANRIAMYFGKNEKTHHILMILPQLYSFFMRIMKVHHLPGMTEKDLASALGVHPFFVKDYIKYARNFQDRKLVKIFEHLQSADHQAKGIGSPAMDTGQILTELVFKITH